MSEVKKCVVCHDPIGPENWERIRERCSDMLSRVDMYGEDCLTENEQVLYHDLVHEECFYLMCAMN